MSKKQSEKEAAFMREYDNGKIPHYFTPDTPAAREAREAKKRKLKTATTSAAQVVQMRAVAGTGKKSVTKGVDAQVAEMRRAAAEADCLPEV